MGYLSEPALDIDASNILIGTLPLGRLPATLTGKDADTLDSMDSLDFPKITIGTYAGNDGVNRAIAHGLGKAPKIVLIVSEDGLYRYRIYDTHAQIFYEKSATHSKTEVTAPNATNFYVGNAGDYSASGNHIAIDYRWVAIG